MGDTTNRTEQEYLDLAQSFKDRMEEKNREQLQLKQTYMSLKKQMCQLYGLLRSIQDEMESDVSDEILLDWLINECRSICSRNLFKEEEERLGIYDI